MSILKKKDGSEVTYEDLLGEINKSIDAKVNGGINDFATKKLPEMFKSQLEPFSGQFTTMNDALGKLTASLSKDPPKNEPVGGSPEVNAQVKSLTERLNSTETAMKRLQQEKQDSDARAEKTERHAFIRQSLQGLPFISDKAAATAFSIVEPYVRRLDDQSLVATENGENFPVDAFAKDYLDKEHGYLFKSSGSSGSGLPANSGSGLRNVPRADINDIKPGMSIEKRKEIMDAINAAAPASV